MKWNPIKVRVDSGYCVLLQVALLLLLKRNAKQPNNTSKSAESEREVAFEATSEHNRELISQTSRRLSQAQKVCQLTNWFGSSKKKTKKLRKINFPLNFFFKLATHATRLDFSLNLNSRSFHLSDCVGRACLFSRVWFFSSCTISRQNVLLLLSSAQIARFNTHPFLAFVLAIVVVCAQSIPAWIKGRKKK